MRTRWWGFYCFPWILSHHIECWATTLNAESPHWMLTHHIVCWLITLNTESSHSILTYHIECWLITLNADSPHWTLTHHIEWKKNFPHLQVKDLELAWDSKKLIRGKTKNIFVLFTFLCTILAHHLRWVYNNLNDKCIMECEECKSLPTI